ncbi:redoxin domain-containing protein [Georgenia sunbinii]|uniref:redoxin domain-containing protein n=1 Tax=Georgenia sunbinii TaxID=3117728 RepID=UPI002F263036
MPTTRAGSPLGRGELAPELELPDTHGTPVRVGGVRAAPQLVVFLPFAFTATCAGELRDLHALRGSVPSAGVVAISCDPAPALRAWAAHEGVDVPLLSDFWPHGRAAAAFGVLDDDGGFATRGSFLLDGEGRVAWSTHSPAGLARSVADYRAALTALTG